MPPEYNGHMCGILGITQDNEPLVREAAKTIRYRGPDFSSVVTDKSVTLGHNRLSIIDLDPRSNQPMKSANDTMRIVFNGEIYNYREIRKELQDAGAVFRTESDTEVLLQGYAKWGAALLGRLRGMYALALHDKVKNKLILMTDYSGMKPLFYAKVGDTFMFGSELKAVLSMMRSVGVQPKLNTASLSLYYALGYVPAPQTIVAGVSRMPRRSVLTVDLMTHAVSQTSYALPSTTVPTSAQVEALLEQSVERHLVADVPVGLFFSGGTDSSLIAAMLAKRNISLHAFSLEIDSRPEDRHYFDSIAEHLRLNLHRSFFGPKEFDDIYEEVVAKIDEPLYDSSLFPTYYISREARKHAKVVLSGDGGDEYFLGYPRSVVLSRIAGAPLDSKVGLLDLLYVYTPRFRGKVKIFEKLFELMRRPISYYLLTMSPAKDFIGAYEWRTAKSAIAAHATTPLMLDADSYLENDLLRKLDSATMYNSIEGRVPLLDPDVMAAAQALMPHYGPLKEKKPILKEILARYLPAKLVYRGKRGFGLDAPVYFASSRYLKMDLETAIRVLGEKGVLPPRPLPPMDEIIARRPLFAWQLIFLYHALHNCDL